MRAVLTLPAYALLSRFGFNDGHPRADMRDALQTALNPADRDASYLWRDVLADLVIHLLIPAITYPITWERHSCHNPVRLTNVAGLDISDEPQLLQAMDILEGPVVILPASTVVDYALHHRALRREGIPTQSLVMAFHAGLAAEEIRAHHAAGALTPDALTTLAALSHQPG